MGRRLILLLCAMATMVVLSAGAALAVVIIGTNVNEDCATIAGPPAQPAPTPQDDNITLAGGNDTCDGLDGPDEIYGDSGNDTLTGSGGTDQIYGGSGTDNIDGGQGTDRLYGDGGANDTVSGGQANGDWVSVIDGDTDDTAEGGPGNADVCAVDAAGEADAATCETVKVLP